MPSDVYPVLFPCEPITAPIRLRSRALRKFGRIGRADGTHALDNNGESFSLSFSSEFPLSLENLSVHRGLLPFFAGLRASSDVAKRWGHHFYSHGSVD